MCPEIVNLDHAVASFLEMRHICWEMGIASFMNEGMSRAEAAAKLRDVWTRASMRRERRWVPRKTRGLHRC